MGVGLLTALVLSGGQAAAQNAKADVTVNTSGGYARVVFNFTQDVETDVRMSNAVLIITFKRPVDVGVDRIASSNDYFSAARRDPDGRGVRIALNRKVRVNSMVAGERLFVDLLPESWTGPTPPLPQEVVEDLSRRMREAERRSRQQQAVERERVVPTQRVRVSRLPTFTRYIFELPELLAVKADRGKDKLKLTFGAPLKFDLADTKSTQPQLVRSLDGDTGETTTSVAFVFVDTVDVRTFREDNNYVVDVMQADSAAKVDELPAPLTSQKDRELPPSTSMPLPPEQAPNGLNQKTENAPSQIQDAAVAMRSEVQNKKLEPARVLAEDGTTCHSGARPYRLRRKSCVMDKIKKHRSSLQQNPRRALLPDVVPVVERNQIRLSSRRRRQPEATADRAVSPNDTAAGRWVSGSISNFQSQLPRRRFMRSDTLWLVFDTTAAIDTDCFEERGDPSRHGYVTR